jgi:glycosyltransferase involved in cell wall biosynthesis
MYNPLISIIIVVYNAEKTIASALESVLDQTYQNRQLIIIDGGSKDDTLSVIGKFHDKLDYFVSEKDDGIYDAMNKGIKAAKGEWLYFLGSDDIFYDKDVLMKVFTWNEVKNYDLLYGNVRFKSNDNVFGGSRTYLELIEKNINHQAIFYKMSLLNEVGWYNTRYKVLADYDLNLRIFKNNEFNTKYLPVDICLFNNKGISNITIDRAFFTDKLFYFTKVEKFPANAALLQHYNFYSGFSMLAKGEMIEGITGCIKAFVAGKRKLYYILTFVKFILGSIGIGKKIRIV